MIKPVHILVRYSIIMTAAALWPSLLAAQEYCMPEAKGVPGLSGPPKWRPDPFTAANFPDQLKRLDDPRWRGALSHVIDGEVEFRALFKKPDSLYLSWYAKADGKLDLNGDQVFLGIKQVPGKPPILIRLKLKVEDQVLDAAPPPIGIPDPVGVEAYQWTGTWQPLGVGVAPPVPPWIKGTTRGWTQPGPGRWAFQMVLPISNGGLNAGLDLQDPFEMWYALVDQKATTAALHPWPAAFGFSTDAAGANPSGLNPNQTWGLIRLGAPAGVTCTADVELTPLQVGTENLPSSKILFTAPPATANLDTNVFFARPKNIRPVGGAVLPAGSIQARIFVANWGTQVLDETFWREITPTDPADVQHNLGSIAAGDVAGAGPPRNDIHFRWAMAMPERCMYFPSSDPNCLPRRQDHQCILVQLSSAAAPQSPLVFRNQSVARNMDFVSTMSPFRRTAEVSVVGLAPLADGRPTRDVYLNVETVNMPAVVTSAPTVVDTVVVPGRDVMIVAGRDTALKLEWGVVRLARGDTALIPTKDTIVLSGETPVERMEALRRAADGGRLTMDDVDAHAPTYRIYAYHTTGDSITIDGLRLPLLEAQTSFGYWVRHDGEITGWKHRLEGEHLVKVAPNYYKIEVPNNGTTTVTTTIEALEFRRYALSLHAGVSLPHGTSNTTHNPGFGITADAEYWWTRKFAVAALLGYHRFGGEAANPDLDLFHASAALEARVITGRPSVLVDAGGGFYRFSPGGGTDPGVHAGVGVEFDVRPTVALGATGRVHTVFTTGSNTTFSSLQVGGRIRF